MAPTHVPQARARFRRATLAAACAAAAFLCAPSPAAAGHEHHAAASPEAPSPAAHAHHTPTPVTTAPDPGAAASMWQISSPSNPRVAKGPRGPLWEQYTPVRAGYSPMGGTLAESYVARQLEAAQSADAVATKAALTTAQATKKLTKKCQRLVKITKAKQIAKLKKADRKARSKCLEQRRKIIADSKKKPETTAPAPGTSTPTPTPAPTGPTPQTPAPSPTPTNPTPAPTTPTPPANPNECTTPGTGTVVVTAIDEGQRFDVNMCGIKAGDDVPFRFVYSDESGEPHDLTIASAVTGDDKPSGEIAGGSEGVITSGSKTFTADLTAGTWYLICSVPGHGSMRVPFKVFA